MESSKSFNGALLGLREPFADFFQLHRETMPQGTFRAEFIEQHFGFIENLGGEFAFNEFTETTLNFGFGEQDFLPRERNARACQWYESE